MIINIEKLLIIGLLLFVLLLFFDGNIKERDTEKGMKRMYLLMESQVIKLSYQVENDCEENKTIECYKTLIPSLRDKVRNMDEEYNIAFWFRSNFSGDALGVIK